MITKTFKLTVATDNEKQMQEEEHFLSLMYGAEEVDPEETKWIPIRERMPKDRQMVLFYDIDDDIMLGYHIKGRPNTHFSQDGTYDDIKNVKAWMPLPEPYKAESEEIWTM